MNGVSFNIGDTVKLDIPDGNSLYYITGKVVRITATTLYLSTTNYASGNTCHPIPLKAIKKIEIIEKESINDEQESINDNSEDIAE